MAYLRRIQETEQAAIDAVLEQWSDNGARSVERLKAELRAMPGGARLASEAGADDLIADYLDTLPSFRRVPTGGRGLFFEPVRMNPVKTGTVLGREGKGLAAGDYLTVEFSARTIVRQGQ